MFKVPALGSKELEFKTECLQLAPKTYKGSFFPFFPFHYDCRTFRSVKAVSDTKAPFTVSYPHSELRINPHSGPRVYPDYVYNNHRLVRSHSECGCILSRSEGLSARHSHSRPFAFECGCILSANLSVPLHFDFLHILYNNRAL